MPRRVRTLYRKIIFHGDLLVDNLVLRHSLRVCEGLSFHGPPRFHWKYTFNLESAEASGQEKIEEELERGISKAERHWPDWAI